MRPRLRVGDIENENYGRHAAVCGWANSNLAPTSEFLDIGCGFGWVEEFLVENSHFAHVYALEPDDQDLVEFRRRLSHPQVTSVVGSALNLPFQDGSIDLCLSSEVLEHIPKSSEFQFFSEIARVLRPGGRALITTPNADPLSKFGDPAWWISGHRHYTIASVRQFAESAGLKVEIAEVRGGWTELAALYDLYISKWIFGRQRLFAHKYSTRLSHEWSQSNGKQFMGIWLEVVRP